MALETILIGLGADLAGKVIGKKLGPQFGGIAEGVINQLGEAFGVPAEPDAIEAAIKSTPRKDAELMVREVEVRTADAILAEAKLVEARNKTLEMQIGERADERKEPWFAWAWRPAAMWGLGVLWFWNVIVLHLLNAYFKISLPPVDLVTMIQLTLITQGLYMGGHTVKELGKNALDAVKQWKGTR